jgi:SAM-dependent methyltransferase
VGERTTLGREDGRRLFGIDPVGYAEGRPGYPREVFDILERRCGLGPGTATLEIGPGGGQATAELLARGADPLLLIEPDPELAAYLRTRFGRAVDIQESTFEACTLESMPFDLAAAASSWHWVDSDRGFAKVALALRPGGWWAMWWNVFQDPEQPHELSSALDPLLAPLRTHVLPSADGSTSSYVLDRSARLADVEASGFFEGAQTDRFSWSLELDGARTRALFGTYSPILSLPEPERRRLLAEIGRIVDRDFGGRVARRCVTILYTASRNTRQC